MTNSINAMEIGDCWWEVSRCTDNASSFPLYLIVSCVLTPVLCLAFFLKIYGFHIKSPNRMVIWPKRASKSKGLFYEKRPLKYCRIMPSKESSIRTRHSLGQRPNVSSGASFPSCVWIIQSCGTRIPGSAFMYVPTSFSKKPRRSKILLLCFVLFNLASRLG